MINRKNTYLEHFLKCVYYKSVLKWKLFTQKTIIVLKSILYIHVWDFKGKKKKISDLGDHKDFTEAINIYCPSRAKNVAGTCFQVEVKIQPIF